MRIRLAHLAVWLLSAVTVAVPGEHTYGVGSGLSYSFRRATWLLEEAQVHIDGSRKDLVVWDASFGRRFFLHERIRLALDGLLGFGSTVEDTIDFSGGAGELVVQERNQLLHFTIQPELRFSFDSPDNRIAPYLLGGASLSYVRYRDRFFTVEDLSEVGYDRAADLSGVVPGILVGLGAKIPRRAGGWIDISYALRYWVPVRYSYERGLPLESVPYHERFISHGLRVQWVFVVDEGEG